MSGYAKVHQTILDSSIWSEPHATRIVWITMLAMADADGVVSASVSGLARRAVVTRDECEAALETFLAPDPDSSDGTSGERIERVRGGWRILNHGHYRRLGSQEDRKEKARDRAARSYAKKSAEKRREAQPLASASASVSDLSLPEQDLSQPTPTQDCTDARAVSSVARLRLGYQERYEAATRDAWMGASGVQRELEQIAAWAERQAEIRGRSPPEVIAEWLDALFAHPWAREKRWPLRWAAKDPAAVIADVTGETDGSARRQRDADLERRIRENFDERMRADERGEYDRVDELDRERAKLHERLGAVGPAPSGRDGPGVVVPVDFGRIARAD